MSAIKLTAKTHEEWLKNREGGIGSSEVASILGLNPYETPLQLWMRKTGRTPAKEETFAMKAGHYLEDAVAKFFQDESGLKIIKSSSAEDVYVHPDFDWARVSPDRLFYLTKKRNSNQGILECKTTQKDIDPENIPPYWFCQIQYQLGVMGLKRGALAWLKKGRDFDYRMIDFNESFFSTIMENVERFYKDNILEDVAPQVATVDDILLSYPNSESKSVEATTEVLNAYSSLRGLKEEKKSLEDSIKVLEDSIKMALTDSDTLVCNGDILATWKTSKASKKFDVDAFKEENPELYERYLKEQQGSRRFLLK